MTRFLLTTALLIAAAAPGFATPGDATSQVNAQNWDVMLNQYPARARAAREQGPVGFRVTLDKEGYASDCVVTSSSGYPSLDSETCRLIMTRGEFRGINDGSGRRTNAIFEGVVNWKLPSNLVAATTAPSTPAPIPAVAPAPSPAPVRLAQADPSEKLICRRQARIGTLAGYERTCLSKGDWDRLAENQRSAIREMADKGHTNLRQENCQTGNMSAGC